MFPAIMDEMRNWGNTFALVGRLKPGVSIAQAQAESDILFPQLKAAHQDWWEDYSSTLTGLKEFVTGKLRRSLIVLWCAVGVILLIVGVNLSNLLLARAAARSKEFAMRMALGAGRGRLIRQLLTESLVLSIARCAAWPGVGICHHHLSGSSGIHRAAVAEQRARGWRRAGVDNSDRSGDRRFIRLRSWT